MIFDLKRICLHDTRSISTTNFGQSSLLLFTVYYCSNGISYYKAFRFLSTRMVHFFLNSCSYSINVILNTDQTDSFQIKRDNNKSHIIFHQNSWRCIFLLLIGLGFHTSYLHPNGALGFTRTLGIASLHLPWTWNKSARYGQIHSDMQKVSNLSW